MEILRQRMKSEFEAFAHRGSGVVIGLPGAGKTYLLKDFSQKMLMEQRDCLYIPIDKLGVERIADLGNFFGYSGTFSDYLKRQRASSAERLGFVIVDAFDAARSETAQTQFLFLIQNVLRELNSTWHVIVSVRTYDGRKSTDLLNLFPPLNGNDIPDEFQLPDVKCRHFCVHLLNNDELHEVSQSIPHLEELILVGSDNFRELLRTPFNIWLIERLLDDASNIHKLTRVNTEIELLDLFWNERVAKGFRSEAREAVANRVAQGMVNDHTLSVRKDRVYRIEEDSAWHGLLSSNILEEAGRHNQTVAFSHNIIFDFAVSALLIEDSPEDLERFINADPSRPLFLRPSLNYYFTRLWHSDPEAFWKLFWHILPSQNIHFRLFARLLPTTVIARELSAPLEITPLIEQRKKDRALGDKAIVRLIQALRAMEIDRDSVWLPILDSFSKDCSRAIVGELTTYLSEVLARSQKELNDNAHTACGAIARNIMSWIWLQRENSEGFMYDRLGGSVLVPIIAKTFFSNPIESSRVLEPVFAIVKKSGFPISYLYHLTHELDSIWPAAPNLVAPIFRTVFDNSETSEEKTDMGTPILPLTSTRRQDYEMCYYFLQGHFPKFLKASPKIAAETIISCLNNYIIEQHVLPYLKPGVSVAESTEHFLFRGRTSVYLPDFSHIWTQGRHPQEPTEMISHLLSYVQKIANDGSNAQLLEDLLDVFRDNAKAAFFWSSLLKVAKTNPAVFIDKIFDLCCARAIQLGYDTIYELSCFIENAAKHFSHKQLEILERTIVSLVEAERVNDNETPLIRI
jgi:hypothetical protein